MEIRLGEVFSLESGINGSTGYTSTLLLSPGLRLVDKDVIPSRKALQHVPGSGSTLIYYIQAVETGNQYYIDWYHQPWMPQDIPIDIIHRIKVV